MPGPNPSFWQSGLFVEQLAALVSDFWIASELEVINCLIFPLPFSNPPKSQATTQSLGTTRAVMTNILEAKYYPPQRRLSRMPPCMHDIHACIPMHSHMRASPPKPFCRKGKWLWSWRVHARRLHMHPSGGEGCVSVSQERNIRFWMGSTLAEERDNLACMLTERALSPNCGTHAIGSPALHQSILLRAFGFLDYAEWEISPKNPSRWSAGNWWISYLFLSPNPWKTEFSLKGSQLSWSSEPLINHKNVL